MHDICRSLGSPCTTHYSLLKAQTYGKPWANEFSVDDSLRVKQRTYEIAA